MSTYRIGNYNGVPIKLHWSLGLLFIFLAYFGKEIIHLDDIGLIWFLILVLSLFLSVIFHELGHAYAAKKYGIVTRDIIISPVGGITRLEHIPKPVDEIKVALAGPIANLLLAGLILIILLLIKHPFSVPTDSYPESLKEFLRIAFWLNLILFGFNLLPAFPMDGGRILRALLRTKMETKQATKIASRVGIIMAFTIIGLAFGFRYKLF